MLPPLQLAAALANAALDDEDKVLSKK